MYFRCKTGKMGVQQLILASAVNSLFVKQSMDCIITNLEPMTFQIKGSMAPQMAQRLLADRIPKAIVGYRGEIVGDQLVVSKEEQESD